MSNRPDVIFLAVGGALALLLLCFPLVRALRKRERPRFSIAWLLAFVVALSIGLYGGVKWWTFDPEEAEWQALLEQTLAHELKFDHDTVAIHSFRLDLRTYSKVYVLTSPSLDESAATIVLHSSGSSLREFLDAVCAQAGLVWSAEYQAIYIKKRDDPDPQETPIAKEPWEREILRHLAQRRISLEDVDTPFTEELGFINSITGVRFGFAPEFEHPEEKSITFCPVRDMRLVNALTWICYLADAEWSLKPTPDGKGMVWIEPRKKNPKP